MDFFDFHHHKKGNLGIYNLNLGEEIPHQYFSVGIHPKDIDEEWEAQINWIKKTARHSHCIAIGECGLDGLISIDENLQQLIFEQQIIIANELQKPIIIHCVKRHSQLLAFQKIAKVPMIVHGFNNKWSIAEALLQKGFYLSLGEKILWNDSLNNFLSQLPINQMFLEPDDAEINISEIYEQFAQLTHRNCEEVNQHIKKNLKKVFGKGLF